MYLPLAFPTVNFGVVANCNGGVGYSMATAGETLNSFNASAWNTSGVRVATTGYFFALGC